MQKMCIFKSFLPRVAAAAVAVCFLRLAWPKKQPGHASSWWLAAAVCGSGHLLFAISHATARNHRHLQRHWQSSGMVCCMNSVEFSSGLLLAIRRRTRCEQVIKKKNWSECFFAQPMALHEWQLLVSYGTVHVYWMYHW